ncbi:hypothetical protein N658DRAFT_534932 [Parathielavia hyrcaniae]|uniref:Thiamine-triphosphatase n=1 Tax=Parathielavia hyrcaniae TaxID=113614 RepID=A0AAN6Q1A0_9PEZI|nr:hypothetical protein N658DRAFT_534932 [Parathielavia hyrcaniae]
MLLRATRALPRASTTTGGGLPQFPHPKPTTTNTTTSQPTILEVERKFRRLTVPALTNINRDHHHPHPNHHINNNNNINPPAATQDKYTPYSPTFTSVATLPTRTIHDTYYDTPDHALCSRGAWIRRRNGAWEAKVKRPWWKGDFVNSRFEELRGAERVREVILETIGGRDEGEGVEGFGRLGKMAEFVTTREAWLVDGEFKVVRDRMDFGHEVGEVELQVEFHGQGGGGDGDKMGEEEKAAVMEDMDRRIEGFMKRYAWAWEEGGAVGKLTAYFAMMKRRGERA